ncbi:MAG: TetR/AcrR family transcriptional regulator [Chloroflexi bacterium]|nr:TetR/AcrR family transcriptional regulator [Chloroflexota bacterium]
MNQPVKGGGARARQRERSDATRRRIREAALRLFVEHGYRATTIDSIAAEAGVAVQTVYFVFGNKRALLSEILDVAIAGDDAPSPLLGRPWVAELRQEGDPVLAVRLLARQAAEIVDRQASLFHVVRGAAAVDPEVEALLHEYRERRLATLIALLQVLADRGALAPGLDVTRAAEIVFALTSHEVHQLLVVGRGWPVSVWATWLEGLLIAQLLP